MGRGAKISFIVSLVLYVIALIVPAVSYANTSGHADFVPGWVILPCGLMGALAGVVTLISGETSYAGCMAWFANPVLLLAWLGLAVRAPRMARNASIAALGLAMLFLMLHTIAMPDSGTMNNVHGSVGFYLWLASMGAAWFAAIQLGEHAPAARDPAARYVDW